MKIHLYLKPLCCQDQKPLWETEDLESSTVQQWLKHWCLINTVLIINSKLSTIQAPMK